MDNADPVETLIEQFYESLVHRLDDGYTVTFTSEAGAYRCEVTRNKRGYTGVADTARSALVRAVGAHAKNALFGMEVKRGHV